MIDDSDIKVIFDTPYSEMPEASLCQSLPIDMQKEVLRRWFYAKFLIVKNTCTERYFYYIYMSEKRVADLRPDIGHLYCPDIDEVKNNIYNIVIPDHENISHIDDIIKTIKDKIEHMKKSLNNVKEKYPHIDYNSLSRDIDLLCTYDRMSSIIS